jgi:hypothetical protein
MRSRGQPSKQQLCQSEPPKRLPCSNPLIFGESHTSSAGTSHSDSKVAIQPLSFFDCAILPEITCILWVEVCRSEQRGSLAQILQSLAHLAQSNSASHDNGSIICLCFKVRNFLGRHLHKVHHSILIQPNPSEGTLPVLSITQCVPRCLQTTLPGSLCLMAVVGRKRAVKNVLRIRWASSTTWRVHL